MVKFKVPLKDILGTSYYRYELTSSNYNPKINDTITLTCTCKNILGNPIPNKELTLIINGIEQGTSTTNEIGIATWTYTITNGQILNFNVGTANITIRTFCGMEEVPNGANLNNYTDVGFYYQGANDNTSNMTNLPNDDHRAFCLFVEHMGGNARKQTLTYQTGNFTIFVREKLWDNSWTTWYKIPTNNANDWWSTTIATYGTLNVNTALRLCQFRYTRSSYNFTSTSTITLHSQAIPSTYRPKFTMILSSWNPNIGIAVETTGNIIAHSETTGSKNITGTAMWHY